MLQHGIACWLCYKNEDQGKIFNALLTDLTKAFDCLSHELLIMKLHSQNSFKVTYQTKNKESKLIQRIAHGKKLYLEYHKLLFLYNLILFCVTCFG